MHRPTAQRIVKIALSGLGATLILGSAVFYIIDQSERERERERDNDTELLVDKTAPTAPQQTTATFSQLPEEKIINTAKPPDLIEQPFDSEEESFAVLATKLDPDNHIYQLAFTLSNTSDQDKDFYLIPVSLGPQTRFQGIKGNLQGGSARWNFDSGWSFDKAKHKQELLPELAQAYDDIDNNGYTGTPIKLTLTPKTTLTAQSEWAVENPKSKIQMSNQIQNPNDAALKPVYFLVYGSAGGVKDELTILNVHSHPQQGENWTVSFETKGTADLTITPNDQATIDDDEFVSLSCDNEERTPQLLPGDIIYYPNWQCDGKGKVVHYTKKAGKHTLRFEFGGQTAFAYNNPDTETLRPNGAGSETATYIVEYPSSDEHWDKVDEETADDNSTYVYAFVHSAGGSWNRDLYALPAHTGSGTINSVTVYARLRDLNGSNSTGKISIRTNGTTYDTSAYALTTSWADFSNQWTTNPQTGSAWTWDEIDALEAGISLYEIQGGAPGSILKGQPVSMADGSQKHIEDVRVGDEVISFDLDSWSTAKNKVVEVKQGSHDDYLVFNSVLKTSLEHLIWASGEFKEAKDIKTGDFLLDLTGNEIEVVQIEYVQDRVETYDLIVEKNHNFFASNYLVHNQNKSGACTQVYVVVDYTPAATGPSLIFKGGLRFKGGYTIK